VRQRLKVPAFVLMAGFALAACGGEAESAADLESEFVQVEGESPAEVEEAQPAPPAAEPRPQETRPTPAPPPAATDPGATPPRAEPEPEPQPAPEEALVEPDVEPVAVPAGARIHTIVDRSISTRSHTAGDVFQVRVTQEVLAVDGMVLVPEGALLEGRVVEARSSSSADEEAALVLGFETLIVDGQRFPFHGTVVETELKADAGASGTRSAATVATGAAAGAVLGQILGRDTRSTVGGAVVGAAAGAGVALTTRDGHAVLEEGSRMIVQVDQPVILAGGS
jgi:hypothetical protein